MANALLSGILVVSFEQAVAAPYCTSRLAQDGARVIKVERPEGDFARGYDEAVRGQTSYFVWLNAGKESIALDLTLRSDLALARSLVGRADVVVQNLAPGAIEKLGIDLRSERRKRPHLICCSVSGYGDSGPYARMKAYDLLVQAESGLSAVTGGPEAPARVGISLCDIATGLQAYAAILKALLRRRMSGEGANIELSLFGSIAEWMAVPLLQTRYSGKQPQRLGLAHPSIAPYGVFETADGIKLLIAVQNEREWASLTRLLSAESMARDSRFATNVDRVRHRSELDRMLSEIFQRMRSDDVLDRLARNQIAYGRLRTVQEALAHPALRWMRIATPRGEVDVPQPATGAPERQRLGVPALDQDGSKIRMEFRMSHNQSAAEGDAT